LNTPRGFISPAIRLLSCCHSPTTNPISLKTHFKRNLQTDKVSNAETGNGILFNYLLGTQQRQQQQKVKTMNMVIYSFKNLLAVANGEHGSSLKYHHGAFLRSLKI
jgi:hypothetical protein